MRVPKISPEKGESVRRNAVLRGCRPAAYCGPVAVLQGFRMRFVTALFLFMLAPCGPAVATELLKADVPAWVEDIALPSVDPDHKNNSGLE